MCIVAHNRSTFHVNNMMLRIGRQSHGSPSAELDPSISQTVYSGPFVRRMLPRVRLDRWGAGSRMQEQTSAAVDRMQRRQFIPMRLEGLAIQSSRCARCLGKMSVSIAQPAAAHYGDIVIDIDLQ
jgi:hypothetical protein